MEIEKSAPPPETPPTEVSQQERTARYKRAMTVFTLQRLVALLYASKRDAVNP